MAIWVVGISRRLAIEQHNMFRGPDAREPQSFRIHRRFSNGIGARAIADSDAKETHLHGLTLPLDNAGISRCAAFPLLLEKPHPPRGVLNNTYSQFRT